MIPVSVLEQYQARLVRTRANQRLFDEGDTAQEFFQVEAGSVKMFILNDEGQEFTQGIFQTGESFGEPALLGDFPYPASAVVVEEGSVWRLAKPEFIRLLQDHFELHLKLDKVLCNRLQYKSMILTEISAHGPEHRLLTILKYLKARLPAPPVSGMAVIPYTRQQLADMTGLRVETVIRTIKKMEKEGKLKIEDRKIHF